jgi:hypothetical protein
MWYIVGQDLTKMDAKVDLPLPLVPHNKMITQRLRSLNLQEQ